MLCGEKKTYDKKTAETIRNQLQKSGRKMRIYQCPICNRWHLTHKPLHHKYKKIRRYG